MGILVVSILLIIVIALQVAGYKLLTIVEKEILGIEKVPKEKAKVTDPFQKPKEIYSSTSHIVVPKTPTEIRNQNFKKIKEGMEYGDIARE